MSYECKIATCNSAYLQVGPKNYTWTQSVSQFLLWTLFCNMKLHFKAHPENQLYVQ